MSDDFICPVVTVKMNVHPNADNLEVAECSNGKVSIVGKNQFKTDERVVCIPQHAIVPQNMLREIGLEGRLSGKDKNIVRPIKLRGVYSDCILYPLSGNALTGKLAKLPDEGTNMAGVLGIKKRMTDHPMIYEGVVMNPRNVDKITYGDYDILNLYRWQKEDGSSWFDGKEVHITEKLHGTWVEFSYHPQCPELVTSKGFSKKELVFQMDGDSNKNNLYVNMYKEQRDRVQHLFKMIREDYGADMETPIRLMGEIFGPKVQDLKYSLSRPTFRAFDIYIGEHRKGIFLSSQEFFFMCKKADIETVPLLYQGMFDFEDAGDTVKEVHEARCAFLDNLAVGVSSIDDETMKEGVVIKPVEEKYVPEFGRTIAKYVSEEYLNKRKNGTEFN